MGGGTLPPAREIIFRSFPPNTSFRYPIAETREIPLIRHFFQFKKQFFTVAAFGIVACPELSPIAPLISGSRLVNTQPTLIEYRKTRSESELNFWSCFDI